MAEGEGGVLTRAVFSRHSIQGKGHTCKGPEAGKREHLLKSDWSGGQRGVTQEDAGAAGEATSWKASPKGSALSK